MLVLFAFSIVLGGLWVFVIEDVFSQLNRSFENYTISKILSIMWASILVLRYAPIYHGLPNFLTNIQEFFGDVLPLGIGFALGAFSCSFFFQNQR